MKIKSHSESHIVELEDGIAMADLSGRSRSRTHKIMKCSAGMFDVRLSPNSGTKADIVGGPRRAKTGGRLER